MDKFRAIKLFCRVVEAKSFAAAARDLEIVPSVLSKVIAALESDLEFRLFNRSTRRVSMTEQGASYYEQCKFLLAQLEEAEVTARSGVGAAVGLVRAGLHPAIGGLFVAHAKKFLDQYPKLRVEWSTTNRPSAIMEDGLDVVISIGDVPDSTLTIQKIGTSAVIVCAAPAFIAQFGRPRVPQDLANYRIIIPSRRDELSFAHWTFSRRGQQETVIVPAALIDRDGAYLTRAGIAGAGIVRIFEVSARGFLEQGMMVRILDDWSSGTVPIYAILPSRTRASGKVGAFVNFMRSIVRTQPDTPDT